MVGNLLCSSDVLVYLLGIKAVIKEALEFLFTTIKMVSLEKRLLEVSPTGITSVLCAGSHNGLLVFTYFY